MLLTELLCQWMRSEKYDGTATGRDAAPVLIVQYGRPRSAPTPVSRPVPGFSDLHAYLVDFYSSIGPPTNPQLMVWGLIVGYRYGIRSERKLRDEVHLIWPIAGFANWV